MVKRTVIYEADDGSTHKSSVEADLHNKAIEVAKVIEGCVVQTSGFDENDQPNTEIDWIATSAKVLKTHNISMRKPRGPRKPKVKAPAKEPAKK